MSYYVIHKYYGIQPLSYHVRKATLERLYMCGYKEPSWLHNNSTGFGAALEVDPS